MNNFALLIVIGTGAFGCEGLSAQELSQVESGEMLYEEHCSSCHGERLRSSGAIPDLRELGAGGSPTL
jgi:mono/diheme cytochrome c family protein